MLKVTHHDEVTRFDLARTILGRGRYWTTAYRVDDILIDTGCAHGATELMATLAGASLSKIVNTHSHEDHIGANGPLQQQRPDLEIVAHPLALPVLADPRQTQPLHFYRRTMWGWPEPSQARALADGDIIKTEHHSFQVLYTPGHSPDHLCLFEPDRGWLFTGDLYVGGLDRALRQNYDIRQIITSLKKLTQLPATVLFPGCARVRSDVQAVLAKKIEHLERFGDRVRELDQEGRSVDQIVRALCGGPMFIELVTWGHFSRRRLVLSFLGKNQ